jgi:hypothetical protein
LCNNINDDSNRRAKSWHRENGKELSNSIEEANFFANPSHRKRACIRPIITWLYSIKEKKFCHERVMSSPLETLLWSLCEESGT